LAHARAAREGEARAMRRLGPGRGAASVSPSGPSSAGSADAVFWNSCGSTRAHGCEVQCDVDAIAYKDDTCTPTMRLSWLSYRYSSLAAAGCTDDAELGVFRSSCSGLQADDKGLKLHTTAAKSQALCQELRQCTAA